MSEKLLLNSKIQKSMVATLQYRTVLFDCIRNLSHGFIEAETY